MRAADAAILIVALVVTWSFYRAHRNTRFKFNVFDLIMEHDKLSRLACVFMGSFAVSSWVVVRATIDGKMTEGLFAAYGAIWCAPIIAKLISNPPKEVT